MAATPEHARRLQLLLKRLVHSDSIESLISYDRLISFMRENALHVDDFAIVTGDVADHLARLNKQLEFRAAQVMFMMENGPASLVKQSAAAAAAVAGGSMDWDRLLQLEEAAERRFGPRWEAALAKHLGVTTARIKSWLRLREPIPDGVIEAITEMTEGDLRNALQRPPEITAVVGPRAPAIGTSVVEKHCQVLAARILELGELTVAEAKRLAGGSGGGALRDLIRDGWMFPVEDRDILVSYKRRKEFPEAWDAAGRNVRSVFPEKPLVILEALERYLQENPDERGITLPKWDEITMNALGRGQRGGVNSFVSDFQRRRRGEGIVTWSGNYPNSRWSLRPDWREG